MQDGLRIKVNISNRDYTLTISRDDTDTEQTLREAAQLVNTITDQFRSMNIKDKDEQDYLAMAGLKIAVNALDSERQNDLQPVLEDLRELNFTLSSYLSEA
jgi:hypothetical protein